MTLIQQFEEKIKTASKFIIVEPGGTYPKKQVDLLLTEKYFIVYSHTRASSYNIGGSHYYYLHDLNGEFVESCNGLGGMKILSKERLLKADFKRLSQYYKK